MTSLYARNDRSVAVCLVVLFGLAGITAGQDRLAELRLPLGYYPDGTLKAELRADDAEIQSEVRFKGRQVRYRSYLPDGSLDVALDADDAIVNRQTMTASSQGAVRLEKDGVEVSGVGFDWEGNEKTVKIKSKARVLFQRANMGAFTLDPGKQQTKRGNR